MDKMNKIVMSLDFIEEINGFKKYRKTNKGCQQKKYREHMFSFKSCFQ
jgi:hypothetical protein